MENVLAQGGYFVFGGVAALGDKVIADVRLAGPDRQGIKLVDSIYASGTTTTHATQQAGSRLARRISVHVATRRPRR